MNRTIMMLMLVVGVAVVFLACKSDDSATAPTGTGVISGTVVESSSSAPLPGVTVTAQSASAGTQVQTTDANGTFRFEYATDSARTVTITFTKAGYTSQTLTAQAISGTVTPLNVIMNSSAPISGGTSTGLPSSIFLVSAIPSDISVYGLGANETSYLIWEVRDSVGLPIDAAHADTITFSLLGNPNGGEFIYPVSVITNAQGRATTSLSSGIRSGSVQVVATVQTRDRIIVSQPGRVVIHSGFADPNHFSIAAAQLNFPALGIVGKRDNISILAGDIYSNPIATQTAIYFSTRAGVILSSAFTSPSGQASADLISGNPVPVFANALTPYGNGYHYVIASTQGQNGGIVKDSLLILWSGASTIDSIIPGSLNVPHAGTQRIDFKVCDQFGNTLSKGTTISVSTTGVQAEVAFGLGGSFTIARDINFPPGAATRYSCFVSDSRPDTNYATSATLSISVSSEGNGNATATIGGIIR